jgi:hypothetical protein
MSSLRIVGALVAIALAAPAQADPAKCQKKLLSGLAKYKKTYLKAFEKCLDGENEGKITGTPPVCPDVKAQVKISTAASKINAKVDAACLPGDLTTAGYSGSCALATPETNAETPCAGMPAGTGAEIAACLECWKAAELAEFIAIAYPSHAVEVCGALDSTSTVCSELDCATPQPDQRNLGVTGEETCQRAIGKAGIKYLLAREKVLEKCGLTGQNRTECLDLTMNPKVALSLQKAETKKMTLIKNKCGNNRTPIASPPFCCRVGTGNSCMAATTRDDCTMTLGGTVQEGKTCSAGSCSPVGGGGSITWWENCPEGTSCPGATVGTMDDLIACLDASADAIVDEMLCLQFPTGWPCPSESTTTTTTSTTTTTT